MLLPPQPWRLLDSGFCCSFASCNVCAGRSERLFCIAATGQSAGSGAQRGGQPRWRVGAGIVLHYARFRLPPAQLTLHGFCRSAQARGPWGRRCSSPEPLPARRAADRAVCGLGRLQLRLTKPQGAPAPLRPHLACRLRYAVPDMSGQGQKHGCNSQVRPAGPGAVWRPAGPPPPPPLVCAARLRRRLPPRAILPTAAGRCCMPGRYCGGCRMHPSHFLLPTCPLAGRRATTGRTWAAGPPRAAPIATTMPMAATTTRSEERGRGRRGEGLQAGSVEGRSGAGAGNGTAGMQHAPEPAAHTPALVCPALPRLLQPQRLHLPQVG